MYDIYYDDSEYDYMQHLKPVGLSKEAVLLYKPSTTTTKSKSKTSDQPIQLRPSSPPGPNHELELPDSVQPTPNEHMLSYQDHLQYALPSNSAIPDEGGLFPLDDDPALREVLEALEDDAYVEEDTGDEFFGTIVKDGERDASEEPEWIHEIVEQPSSCSQWESEMAKFKPPLKTPSSSQDPLETCSSTGSPSPAKRKSASRNLPPPSVRGSVAGSAFSMSSSAMFRNEGLTDLDDRFEKVPFNFYLSFFLKKKIPFCS
jgi:protein LTV1